MTGEICLVNKRMIDYLNCKKCSKKIEGPTDGELVYCKTCDADMKVNKCKSTRVVKVDFEEDGTEKLHSFTIFSSVMDKALKVKSAEMQPPESSTSTWITSSRNEMDQRLMSC